MIKLTVSNICSAFAAEVVGSRVIEKDSFLTLVSQVIQSHDSAKDRIPGQYYIVLPSSAYSLVSAGVGKRSQDSNDYVLRTHRGRVIACLKRDKAVSVESVAVVVYTKAAYIADPEVADDVDESARLIDSDYTHVLVAVLASAGPKSPLTTHRFVANLAGGNKEALIWSPGDIQEKAISIASYWDEWDLVAD